MHMDCTKTKLVIENILPPYTQTLPLLNFSSNLLSAQESSLTIGLRFYSYLDYSDETKTFFSPKNQTDIK